MKIFKLICRLLFIGTWVFPVKLVFTILSLVMIPQMKWEDFKYSWRGFFNWLLTGNRKGV